MTCRFTRAQRLLKTDDFSSVFSLRRTWSNADLQIWLRPNGLPVARIGIVVAKRVVPTAVGRNRLKRLIRETFRQHADALAGNDLIVRPKRAARRAELVRFRQALLQLFSRVKPCHGS